MSGARLSIIMPVLNEAANIEEALAALKPYQARGVEVIVVDGGSTNTTPARARPFADHVCVASRGRAMQMNAGRAVALGEVLLFLHADTAFRIMRTPSFLMALRAPAASGDADVR